MMKLHSPHKAAFYSAVVPGLGQIYNKKYWKVPILYIGAGVLVYYLDFNNKQYLRYKKAYVYRTAGLKDEFYDRQTLYTETNLKANRDYWRRNRDLLVIVSAGVYLLNIVDATVDAYLFDYDIGPDLSLHVSPTIINSNNCSNFGLSLSFNLK